MVDFAKAFSVGEFYAQDLLLNIPTYQRNFVWGETQIRTLLNDIKLHIDDPSLNAQYMFIGHALLYQPVVVISGDQTYSWFEDAPSAPAAADETRVQGLLNSIGQGPLWVAGNFGASFAALRSRLTNDPRTQIQVIDGQQRTTVLALLARVLEMRSTPASPSRAPLQQMYWCDWAALGRVQSTNAAYAADYARAATYDPANNSTGAPDDADNTTDSTLPAFTTNSRIREALSIIQTWVATNLPTSADVDAYAAWMLDNMKLTVEATIHVQQQHLIFRSTNALGQRLKASENIKNQILYYASKAGGGYPTSVLAAWNTIESLAQNLPVNSLDELLLVHAKVKGVRRAPNTNTTEPKMKHLFDIYAWFDTAPANQGLFQRSFIASPAAAPNGPSLLTFMEEIRETALSWSQLLTPATMVSKTNLSTQVLLQNLFGLSKMEILPYVIQCYKDNLDPANPATTPPAASQTAFQELLRPIACMLVYGRLVQNREARELRTFHNDLYTNYAAAATPAAAAIAVQDLARDKLLDWNGMATWSPAFQTTLETALEARLQGPVQSAALARLVLCGLEPLVPRSVGVVLDAYVVGKDGSYEVEHVMPQVALNQWNSTSGAWYEEHIRDAALGAAPITTTDVQDALEKIGNKLVVEKKLNKRGRTQPTFQGSGVWRNAGGTSTNCGQHVLDAGDSQPAWGAAAGRSVEYKLQNQRWRDLGRIHYYRFCNLDNLRTPISQANLASSGSRCQHVHDFVDAYATPGTSTNVAPTGSPVVVDPTSPLAGYGAGALFRWGPDQITTRTNALAASAPSVAEWKVW